jgi:hypothetical protein
MCIASSHINTGPPLLSDPPLIQCSEQSLSGLSKRRNRTATAIICISVANLYFTGLNNLLLTKKYNSK